MKLFQKSFSIKSASSGAEVTPEMLVNINTFALRQLTAEEVFVRKYLMAHNAVDRDNERFSEALLDDFSRTFPGKSFLKVHDRSRLPIGLYFDASTEEMTPEQFTALTGEVPRLPEGAEKVKVLWAWVYMLQADFNVEMRSNIDAGIYRHSSIGFNASDITPIKGAYENILFWEYVGPGEAMEGSIVWLGAQPGATVQKHLMEKTEEEGGKDSMEKFLKILARLFPGKTFTEDGLADELKAVLADYSKAEVDKATKPLQDKINELTSQAADGKAYRDELVTQYVTSKAKLKEVDETPEAQAKVKEVVNGYPIDFLKSEVTAILKRVEEKFPSDPQTAKDKLKEEGEKDWREDNPLVVKEEGGKK